MTDLRAAAQQVLEAWEGGDIRWFKRAYTIMGNIRAALAEPQESVQDEFNRVISHSIEQGLDAAEFLRCWREGDWSGCKEFGFEPNMASYTAPPLKAEPQEPAQAISECLAVLRPMVKGRFPHEQALEELVTYAAPPQRPAEPVQEPVQEAEWEVRADGKRVRNDRWQIGIRRIVALLWGNRREFEIDEVVEAVRGLVPNPHAEGDDEARVSAVLAAPAQEPVRLQCTTCGTVYADGVPPQVPVQEPVAYVDHADGSVIWKRARLPGGSLLFTTPPQRKPLTDDQLDDIAVAARRGNLYDLRIAIERAIKIGGKE